MNWLSVSTLTRLRDQLRARGQRPSIVLGNPGAVTAEAAELVQCISDYGALCEAMYLMMSVDGQVANEEREVLKGALRNLSFDEIRGVHIEAMLDAASKRVAEQGRDKRLEAVMEELREDPTRAEVAFVLAAAIAFADNVIHDAENDLLNAMADGLEIDEQRANELLDQAESEMASDRASGA
ncbi:MAG: TerB family tellurite resistance protein [Deltaproteobacteria bacterium]|nr:TerB family tellurite resistance protein [Deltaproteobacteria bacterium]